jgi:tetratricopeptide (TPR) repeat protein
MGCALAFADPALELPSAESSPTKVGMVGPRKLIWGRMVLLVGGPVLFLVALEALLALTGRFEPVHYLRKIQQGQEEYWVTDSRFGELILNRVNMPAPKRIWVPVKKAPGVRRVVLLGESAAAGYPVPDYDLGRMVEVLWAARFPDEPLEVVNLSMTGVNSHVLRLVAEEARQLDPDALVLYAGHNEVIGPYGPVSVFGRQLPGNWLVQLSMEVRNTRTGRAMAELLGAWSPRDTPLWEGLNEFLGARMAHSDPALRRMYGQTRENFAAIINQAVDDGTKVVVCVPAVNLNDWTPLASDPAMPAAQFYEKGKQAEAAGRRDEAWEFYRVACDLDLVRFRADSEVRQLQRDVAEQFRERGVRLVDADRWLHEWNPGFETDRQYFLEHVHLTFEGRTAVAALIVDGLAEALLGVPLPAATEAAAWWKEFPQTMEAAHTRTLFTGADDAAMWYTVQRLLAMKVFASAPDMSERREELAELEYAKRQKFLAEWDLAAIQRAYAEAAKLNDDDPALHGTAGRLLQMGGDPGGAKAALGRTLELMPNRTESALGLAGQLLSENNYDKVEQILRQQEDFDPAAPDIAGLRATMLLAQEQPQEALAYLEKHLRQRPHDAGARRNLATARLERGEVDEAVRHFREVAKAKPDDAYVLNNLAWLLADSPKAGAMDRAEAVDFSRRAVDLEPKVHRYQGTLAYALLRNGQRDEAVKVAQQALEAASAAGDEEAVEMLREKVLSDDRG